MWLQQNRSTKSLEPPLSTGSPSCSGKFSCDQRDCNATSPVNSQSTDCTTAAAATKNKRTRRRRRPRKSRPGGASTGTAGASHEHDLSNAHPKHSSVQAAATQKKHHDAPMTKKDLYFCLRCGVVTLRGNPTNNTSHAVGRVTLVNWDNQVVLDQFVQVPEAMAMQECPPGITPEDLSSPRSWPFEQARTFVAKHLKGKILIGHGLEVDLSALGLVHPNSDVRDTATYAPFMVRSGSTSENHIGLWLPQDLGALSQTHLQRTVNAGSPVEEAVACLDLYKAARAEWEADLVRVAQQKEHRRQLVMRGRMMTPIREHEASSVSSPTCQTGLLGIQNVQKPRVYTDERSVPSTQPTSFQGSNNMRYQDDDASSYASSISSWHSSSKDPSFSEIENMNEFLEGLHFHPQAEQVQLKGKSPGTPTMATMSGQTSSCKQLDVDISVLQQQQLTEEELLQHCLPSQLIDDLNIRDVTSHPSSPEHAMDDWLPEETTGNTGSKWFRSLRSSS